MPQWTVYVFLNLVFNLSVISIIGLSLNSTLRGFITTITIIKLQDNNNQVIRQLHLPCFAFIPFWTSEHKIGAKSRSISIMGTIAISVSKCFPFHLKSLKNDLSWTAYCFFQTNHTNQKLIKYCTNLIFLLFLYIYGKKL